MITLQEAIKQRHAVRHYFDKPLPAEVCDVLNARIAECNTQGHIHLQLVTDEPKAFGRGIPHYGVFSGVSNYIALVGPRDPSVDIRLGYYGEQIVLLAQQLGLNTCWVALTFNKVPSAFEVREGEVLRGVITIGYGKNPGHAHKSKSLSQVADLSVSQKQHPWYYSGIEAALLAPTAINHQKFRFGLNSQGRVVLKAGAGLYVKMDLGIVRYHFEVGAGTDNFEWEEEL